MNKTNSEHDKVEAELITDVEFSAPIGNLMDTKTSQLDDVLNDKLERAFHKPTSQILLHDVAKIASEHDPIDLAYAVTRLPMNARIVVYDNLPDFNAKIIFMINTGSYTRAAIFRHIDNKQIASLLESVPPDEAVSMLDDLSDRRLRGVFLILDPKKAQRIGELQTHNRNSAGRIMTNEFFAFHMNVSIRDVATAIRDNPGIELTRSIFVLNDDSELVGYVPERNLIVNPDTWTLRQVMRPVFHTVGPDASRDEVVDLVERYKIPALPVVDFDDHLLGVITYVDVVEAMEDIADETIASMAGTAEDISEYEPTLRRLVWRAPWLVVTLLAGLTSASLMAHFNTQTWFFAFLPFFVPLITGMSGNVGIQCSTFLVRAMSTGELSVGTRRNAIIRELTLGVLIGMLFGVGCGVLIYLFQYFGFQSISIEAHLMGIIITFGVFGACMTATFLGVFCPFFFARLGIDPAVASGPIVTAFNDVFSTLMFFFIAWVITTLILGW